MTKRKCSKMHFKCCGSSLNIFLQSLYVQISLEPIHQELFWQIPSPPHFYPPSTVIPQEFVLCFQTSMNCPVHSETVNIKSNSDFCVPVPSLFQMFLCSISNRNHRVNNKMPQNVTTKLRYLSEWLVLGLSIESG